MHAAVFRRRRRRERELDPACAFPSRLPGRRALNAGGSSGHFENGALAAPARALGAFPTNPVEEGMKKIRNEGELCLDKPL